MSRTCRPRTMDMACVSWVLMKEEPKTYHSVIMKNTHYLVVAGVKHGSYRGNHRTHVGTVLLQFSHMPLSLYYTCMEW